MATEHNVKNTRLRILHIGGMIGSKSGGLGPCATGLASAQLDLGHQCAIWCSDRPEEIAQVEENWNLRGCVVRHALAGPSVLAFSPAAERRATSAGERFDVLHQHSIWTFYSRVTARWRAAHGRPTVVAPQGTLELWSLARARWKKKLALSFYERANLERASCLHATAASEAESFRRFGLTNPIAVMPNGVPASWLASHGDHMRFRERHRLGDRKVLLFLSRVHPKKGLPLLLEAAGDLRDSLSDWVIVVAGAEECGHLDELKAIVEARQLGNMVRFIGPVFGEEKRDAFAAADLFVLPTQSDNFAIAVAEALGCGVPVITTHGAPWRDIQEFGCGWWVPVGRDGVRNALEDAIVLSPAALEDMGRRGRELVAERYTWTAVAERSVALYQWLMGDGPQPTFVCSD
jgi:glycosyltransferase involved in cell wall biosynthesis